MAKLTKKAVLAANDDIQSIIGFQPALDTKLKQEELFKELYKKVLEVEIDDDDKEDLEDSTVEVIDALAERYPNIVLDEEGKAVEEDESDDEDEPIEDAVVVEEKPKKKGKKEKKGKKAKAEEEVEVAEEKKAPKKKKAKAGKVDPVELAEQIKTDKKINRDGLYQIINDNADLFGDNVDTLLSITNPMVLKKQMRNVLEGGEVEQTKTKKPTAKKKKEEVKEKAAEPTLTEKVNAIDDLDELKAFAKENKASFPGVKAKKFDKVKKLKKALLEVVVETESPSKKKSKKGRNLDSVREERQKRIDWITDYINKEGGKVGRKKLTAKALEAFPTPAKSIRDLISYGKNEKYNKFDELLVEDDAGYIGWKSTMDGASGKKAGGKKKTKAAEVPAEEPVKEKKGKKDKKKDKKKKKK